MIGPNKVLSYIKCIMFLYLGGTPYDQLIECQQSS